MKRLLRPSLPLLAVLLAGAVSPALAQAPNYEIQAVRYGTIKDFPEAALVRGADTAAHQDIAMVFWIIKGGGRIILFDTGFHRDRWFHSVFKIADYIRPDSAARLAGVDPDSVTDIIISHAHWDHMGGIDLFPKATIWIQRDEYAYYTGPAWQRKRGAGGGADPDDVLELVRRNTMGMVKFVNGDDQEIFPGIRAYTGARHTYASQYLLVQGNPPIILASDNVYLYRNLTEHRPGATFTLADTTANLQAQTRMLKMVGSIAHIVPGHDPLQFKRFPTRGRVARIR